MAAKEMRAEGVRISNPDKELWPDMGVTKRELAEYYQAVADTMLPRVRDRPLMLLRCPHGTEDKCFYQKHAKDSVPDVVPRVEVPEKDGRATYLYVNGVASLMGLVQLGVLEFHVWGARRDRLDRPDRLIFDLDPDEDLSFGRVARAALDLRRILSDLGLESFAKLTGGKGIHVVVPVDRRRGWEESRSFTRAVAERLADTDPDGYTVESSKEKRSGKVFIDYLRNAQNATSVADWSPRARTGAPVAVPIAWDEVDPGMADPPRFGIRDAPDRIAEVDPWAGIDGVRQSVTRDMEAAVGA